MKNSYEIVSEFVTKISNIKDSIKQYSKRLGITEDSAMILVFLSISENNISYPEKFLIELNNNGLIIKNDDKKIKLSSKGKIVAKSLCDALKK